MRTGTEPVLAGVPILVLIAVVLAGLGAATRDRWRRLSGPIVLAAGLVVLVVPLWSHYTSRGGGFAVPGLYLTAGAGAILLLSGVLLSLFGSETPSAQTAEDAPTDTDVPVGAIPWGPALVALSGIALTAVGTTMDWLVPHPVTASNSVTRTMDLVGFDVRWVVLGIVVAGVLASVVVSRRAHGAYGGLSLLSAGLASSLVSVWWLLTATGPDGIVDGGLLVAPGVYVTLLGTALFAIAGTLQHTITVAGPDTHRLATEPRQSDP